VHTRIQAGVIEYNGNCLLLWENQRNGFWGKKGKVCSVPRVYISGGKAFAAYVQAKRMVKFMTWPFVNHDADMDDLLKQMLAIVLWKHIQYKLANVTLLKRSRWAVTLFFIIQPIKRIYS
jgi:hypothetical protein